MFSGSFLQSQTCLGKVQAKRACKANPAGENSLFIFTVCVKSVPLYHFKFAYVVLHTAVKEFLKPTSENGEIDCFNSIRSSLFYCLKVQGSLGTLLKN